MVVIQAGKTVSSDHMQLEGQGPLSQRRELPGGDNQTHSITASQMGFDRSLSH